MGIYIYKKDILSNKAKIILSIIIPFLIMAIMIKLVYLKIIPLQFVYSQNQFLRGLFFLIRWELIPSIIIFLILKGVSWWVKVSSIIITYPLFWIVIFLIYFQTSCVMGLGCL